MNEQLQSALAKIIEKAVAGMDSSIAFMQAETPEIVEQLLAWYAVKGLMLSFLGTIMISVGIFVAIKAMKSKPEVSDNFKDTFLWTRGRYQWNKDEAIANEGAAMLIATFVSLSIFFGILFLCFNLMEPIQILIAPKVWLIEYASTLVK